MNSFVEQSDLRVRRTHKLLWEALMAELSERVFEEITVSDICERAMVHRTTFYKHYEDKYALLKQGMQQMYSEFLAEAEHLPPSMFSPEQPPPYFVRLFEHAAQHQQFYKSMLCGEGIGLFQKLIREYITEVALAKVRDLPRINQHLAVPVEIHVQIVAGSALSLLTWWLEKDMPFSPHQMAQYLLLSHSMSPVPT